MSAIDFPPAIIENAQVSSSIASSRHQQGRVRAAVTGTVVSITLQPYTIAFVFGVFISFHVTSAFFDVLIIFLHQESNKNLTGLINVWYLIPVLEYVLRSLTVLLHLLINYYKTWAEVQRCVRHVRHVRPTVRHLCILADFY